MPHIKYLIHFFVIGSRVFLYQFEDRRYFKKIIFYNLQWFRQILHTLGLSTTTAMDDAINCVEMTIQQSF